jgi:hypothetical protein
MGLKTPTKRKPGLHAVAAGKRSSSDSAIMRSAKGEACLADWCGCGGSNDTTVLCHVRKFGIGGMGMKPPNWLGFYGCAEAHRIFDSNGPEWSWEGLFRAVALTQMKLKAKGLITETG